VSYVAFFRSTGWLYITMVSDGPVDTLGRQCKAMAKAKAKSSVNSDDFIAAYSAELLASEAAVRLREEHRNVVAQMEMENEAATAPPPWEDMDAIGEVMTFGGSLCIVPPEGNGVPCTTCHRRHAGDCTFEDRLVADMHNLQCYAEAHLPRGPSLHYLRGKLYTLMAEIFRVVKTEQPLVIAQKYAALRADVMQLTSQCNLHIE